MTTKNKNNGRIILLFIKEKRGIFLWVLSVMAVLSYYDAIYKFIKDYWQIITITIASLALFPIAESDSKYINIKVRLQLSLSRILSSFLYFKEQLHYIARMLLTVAIIYIIVRQAITSDNAINLLERSFIINGADEWVWLISFIAGVILLSVVFAFMEKILVFNPVYDEHEKIDKHINTLKERIKGAEEQLIQTSVLTINNNKEETLKSDKYKLLDRLSISKTEVYKYEEESLKTIVLSKTLFNDRNDTNLHRLIIDKLHNNPKNAEYVWYSDKPGLDNKKSDTIPTLMNSWFDYMVNSSKYSLIDIWNSRNFIIEFRQITSIQHLLLHDINIYNAGELENVKMVGFLDENSANENDSEVNTITHYIRLNIDDKVDALISTLGNSKNSKELELTWKSFIISKLNKEKKLWRIL